MITFKSRERITPTLPLLTSQVDTARTPKADPENDPQKQGPQASVKKLPSTAGIIGVESGRGHVTRKCQPPTVPNFTRHCRSAPLNLSDLVSSLGVEKGGRMKEDSRPFSQAKKSTCFEASPAQ